MIEINLLPLRWRVRRRKVAREAAVVALVTSVVLVGLAGWRLYRGGRLSELRQEMGAKEQEAGSVSVRRHGQGDRGAMDLEALKSALLDEIAAKS